MVNECAVILIVQVNTIFIISVHVFLFEVIINAFFFNYVFFFVYSLQHYNYR